MSENTFFYLHTNGALIYKRLRPDPSDFVRRVWKVDTRDRMCAWRILLETTALGANIERIRELAEKWKCNFADLGQYFIHGGTAEATLTRGMEKMCKELWGLDLNAVWDLTGELDRWPTREEVKERMAVTT